MASAKAYWSDTMTISTFAKGDGTSLNIGFLQNVEIIPSHEVFEMLYSADSIEFEHVKQGEFQVQVNVGFMKIDVAMLQHWLGGSGTSSTGLVDTSSPAQFSITGELTPADGTATNLKATVEPAYTDEMPVFTASRSEYYQNDVTFIGQTIKNVTGPA